VVIDSAGALTAAALIRARASRVLSR
jgi:hypothetical protein